MTLPTEIKIQGFLWRVAKNEAVTLEGDSYATIHYKEQTIYIEPGLRPEKEQQALLHEILHAIHFQSGLYQRKEVRVTEEEYVTAVSMLLYQVLKENDLNFYNLET